MKIQNILSHIVNKQGRKREREGETQTESYKEKYIEGGKDKKKSSGIMSGTYIWIICGYYH
jgi:hypothetical protein